MVQAAGLDLGPFHGARQVAGGGLKNPKLQLQTYKFTTYLTLGLQSSNLHVFSGSAFSSSHGSDGTTLNG